MHRRPYFVFAVALRQATKVANRPRYIQHYRAHLDLQHVARRADTNLYHSRSHHTLQCSPPAFLLSARRRQAWLMIPRTTAGVSAQYGARPVQNTSAPLPVVRYPTIASPCCRAMTLPMMPSLSMHRKHQVVPQRDDGVFDTMAPLLPRKWWWTVQAAIPVGRNRCPLRIPLAKPRDRSVVLVAASAAA